MGERFTLGKQDRLKSRTKIEALFSKGQRLTAHPYRVFYLFQNKEAGKDQADLQCGVGAGTRNFKKAVDRNRIKRLTREAWRLQKKELAEKMSGHTQTLVLFFIYTGKELPSFNFVKEKMAPVIQKLLLIADENNTPAA